MNRKMSVPVMVTDFGEVVLTPETHNRFCKEVPAGRERDRRYKAVRKIEREAKEAAQRGEFEL